MYKTCLSACVIVVLVISGCASHETLLQQAKAKYQLIADDMKSRMRTCLDAEMKKGDLIEQVGIPTYKETTEDGELWVYEIVGSGETVTTGESERLSGGRTSYTETTRAPISKYFITVHINNQGIVDKFSPRSGGGDVRDTVFSYENNRFLHLDCTSLSRRR